MVERREIPEGHRISRLYPVEGDSAIAELWFEGALWSQIELTGMRLDQTGRDRLRDIGFRLTLFPPPADGGADGWEFDLADVEEVIAAAKQWLRDNETHRFPVDEGGGCSAEDMSAEATMNRSRPEESDWRSAKDRFHPGDALSGVVSEVVPFGLLVELPGSGVSGVLLAPGFPTADAFLRRDEDYPIGKRVDVVVLGASEGRLQFDLTLVPPTSQGDDH